MTYKRIIHNHFKFVCKRCIRYADESSINVRLCASVFVQVNKNIETITMFAGNDNTDHLVDRMARGNNRAHSLIFLLSMWMALGKGIQNTHTHSLRMNFGSFCSPLHTEQIWSYLDFSLFFSSLPPPSHSLSFSLSTTTGRLCLIVNWYSSSLYWNMPYMLTWVYDMLVCIKPIQCTAGQWAMIAIYDFRFLKIRNFIETFQAFTTCMYTFLGIEDNLI